MAYYMAKWEEHHQAIWQFSSENKSQVRKEAKDKILDQYVEYKNKSENRNPNPQNISISLKFISESDDNVFEWQIKWTLTILAQYDIDLKRFKGNEINKELRRRAEADLRNKKRRCRTLKSWEVIFPM